MKTAEHIIETVDKLVRKYHTRDPYELCQLLGIKIHYYDLQKKLKGFFYYQSRQKNIVIDHNVNGILERILVAHELGHAVLHTKIAMMHGFQEMEVFDDRSIEENEANFFAAELLLEDGKVLECLSEHTFFETAISDVPHDGFLSAIYSTHPCNDDRVAALQNLGVPYSRY